MAIMIPDSCPSKATVGEKRTFTFLQDLLPDNFTAWYEPVIQGRYPDFTLLADSFGLLVLEVKGWYAKQIAAVTDQDVELHRTEEGQARVERVKNPIRQVREYLFGLMDELRRNEYAILRNHEGEHNGRPCFPCGYGVLLTNITRGHLDEANLSALFPPEQVICRDELAMLEQAGDREAIRRLKRLFPAYFPFDPLTEDQVQTIKGVLHKEVVVRRRPATPGSIAKGQILLPGAVALEVLDARQEHLARSMGEGHHVFFGVAGSGKTSLILARARLLAGHDPSRKVLLLCYNRVLAMHLSAQFSGDASLRGVEVRHFHSWAARRTGLRKQDDESFDDYQARAVTALIQSLEHWPEASKYDAILIDEAHDFEADWFRCCVGLLKGGLAGELLIAVDGAQSLYGRDQGFTWKLVGVQAKGRTRKLSRNYRNTKEIMEFAWQVGQSLTPDDATETHHRVLPTHASRRGPTPCYRACRTAAEELGIIVRLIEGFQKDGILDREVAVLYPRKERTRIDDLCRVLERKGEVFWISNERERSSDPKSLSRPGFRLSTIHSAKGLEFRAVIVCALDLLPNPQYPDEVRDSNLFYVGLTRALERLAVTWVGHSAFTERVQRSNKVVKLPD